MLNTLSANVAERGAGLGYGERHGGEGRARGDEAHTQKALCFVHWSTVSLPAWAASASVFAARASDIQGLSEARASPPIAARPKVAA